MSCHNCCVNFCCWTKTFVFRVKFRNLSAAAPCSSQGTHALCVTWNESGCRCLGRGVPHCPMRLSPCVRLPLDWHQAIEISVSKVQMNTAAIAVAQESERENQFYYYLHQPKGIIVSSCFVIAPLAHCQCLSSPAWSGDNGSDERWIHSFLMCRALDGGFVVVHFH